MMGDNNCNGIDFVDKILSCWNERKAVTVLGWQFRGDFHQKFSKRRVVFLRPDEALDFVPISTGLVLSTLLIAHKSSSRVQSRTGQKVYPMKGGKIREYLSQADKRFSESEVKKVVHPSPLPQCTNEMVPEGVDAVTLVEQAEENAPGPQRKASREEIAFAHAFNKLCSSNPDCVLSSYQVNELVERCWHKPMPGKAYHLSQLGYLIPVVKDGGKRASGYKAGHLTIEICTNPPETDVEGDFLAKVKGLVSRRAEVSGRLEAVEARLKGVETLLEEREQLKAELAKIERAEKILSEAEGLFS